MTELDKIPDKETRERAHREAGEIAARGRAHAKEQNVTEEEIDQAIEEALKSIRSKLRR